MSYRDIVEIYRGENLLEKFKNLRYIKKHKPTWPGLKKTGRFATTKLAHAKEYAGSFPNIIKSAKVDKKIAEFGKNLFDKAHFKQMANQSNYRSRLLLPKKAKEKLKIDILRTISSNIKGLTPLALKGLSIATSLPAQIVVMTLTPTTANADEINMTLEDFAKLAEEAKPKKEKMATGGKAYSTDIKDYYRRAWGIGDRVKFGEGGAAKVLAYLDSLPAGTEIGMAEIMEWVKANKIEVHPKNIYSALRDPNAKQPFKGGEAYVYGKERRALLNRINKKIDFQVTDKPPVVKDKVLKAYHDFVKKNKRLPRANELLKVVGHLYKHDNRGQKILNITKTLRNAGLKWEHGAGLKYTSDSERERVKKQRKEFKKAKFSDLEIEKAITGETTDRPKNWKERVKKWTGQKYEKLIIDNHHMNSLKDNVNLRKITYLPRDVNYGKLMHVEGNIEQQYIKRENILKNKATGWEKALADVNKELRSLINKKLPQKYRGLLNIKIVEAGVGGKLKIYNEGIDWTLSAGKEAGELGKIDFKKLNKSQKAKIIAIANEQKNIALKGTNWGKTALGTLSGVGVAAGTVAAGAEHQAGKPLYDVFVNLPIEFASFGMIPATEISQQLRIRGDLKDKGLSLAERNEKMALYNRAKAQEAIEQDVGEVGLESYALSGLGEGETKDQAYSIKEDEGIELLKRKINRGYNVETGRWEDRDPIAFEEAMLSKG